MNKTLTVRKPLGAAWFCSTLFTFDLSVMKNKVGNQIVLFGYAPQTNIRESLFMSRNIAYYFSGNSLHLLSNAPLSSPHLLSFIDTLMVCKDSHCGKDLS